MSLFLLKNMLNLSKADDTFPLNKTVEQLIGEKDAQVNVAYRVVFNDEKNKYQYIYRLTYNGEKPIFLKWELFDHLLKNDTQVPVTFVLSNKKEQTINFYHENPPMLIKGFAVIDKKITLESTSFDLDLNDIWIADSSTNLPGPVPKN